MNRLAPSLTTRWIIGVLVGAFFAIPLVSTFLFTLRGKEGVSFEHWIALFDPAASAAIKPIWTGLGNSLILAVVTVAIVLLLLAPTMILVNLRFGRLKPMFEFAVLLPISIPAIVLVVGLAPVYASIARVVGSSAWPLALAYAVVALPFAYRAIQAELRLVDVGTLTEAGRSLGAGFTRTLVEIVVPNIRRGILTACILTVAIVLGEYTIAALLNRIVLQTALVQIQQADAYASVIVSLVALAFAFVLLLVIAIAGGGQPRSTQPKAPKTKKDPRA
jgi:putative spermidine/putrescine transport system permease protein